MRRDANIVCVFVLVFVFVFVFVFVSRALARMQLTMPKSVPKNYLALNIQNISLSLRAWRQTAAVACLVS